MSTYTQATLKKRRNLANSQRWRTVTLALSGVIARPACSSVQDDLCPPVLRLAHASAGGYQQMGLATAPHDNRIGRDTVMDQLTRNRVRPAQREAHDRSSRRA
jgi:hypothetical protein